MEEFKEDLKCRLYCLNCYYSICGTLSVPCTYIVADVPHTDQSKIILFMGVFAFFLDF